MVSLQWPALSKGSIWDGEGEREKRKEEEWNEEAGWEQSSEQCQITSLVC